MKASVLLLLALCAVSQAHVGRQLRASPPTPGSAGILTPAQPYCPTYPNPTLDSCILTEDTNEGSCHARSWHVMVPAVSAGEAVNGYPGGIGTWGCNCDSLYTNGAKKDVYACVACKTCSKLQMTAFPQSHYTCNATLAESDSTYSCTTPFPLNPTKYFVNCGLAGPYVQTGKVEVPDDVWMAIKDITC